MRSQDTQWGGAHARGVPGAGKFYLTLLLGSGIFIIAVIVSLTVWTIHQSKKDAQKAADITLENLARTISFDIESSVRQIDLSVLTLRDEVYRNQANEHWDDRSINETIAREDRRHSDSIGLRIFGPDGKLRYGVSNIANRDVDFSQRDEFRQAREVSDDTLLVTPPFVGPVAQQRLIVLVRRITDLDGAFGGAIYNAIPVDGLTKAFAALDLGPGGSVAIYHSNFVLAARFPDLKVGTTTISDQLRAIIASGVQSARFDNLSPVDGVRRTGHVRKVGGLPYYISVALADDDYLARWRHSRDNVLIFSAVSIAIVLLGLIALYRAASSWREMFGNLTVSEEKLRGLFELSPIGIARNTLDGRFVEFNESFRAITGYDTAELKVIDYWELTPEKYVADELHQVESLKSSGSYGPYEKEYVRKDGSLVPVSLRGMLVTGHDGAKYIWSLVEDITERKLANESRAKSEFLMMMSHELRTPLNAVLGYAEMISLELHISNRIKSYSDSIHEAGQHLMSIINDILDISAVEAGKLSLHSEDVDLVHLLETSANLVEPRAREQHLHLEMDVEHLSTVRIMSDGQRIKQILLNLLGNAVKFTPEGGRIKLRAADAADGGVSFTITDNGIGMDAAGIAKALSVFGQVDSHLARKFQGTGLGLPLCRKLTEALGGRLEIESELGKGTVVTVRLPGSFAAN